jgi:hypothetical protein
LVPRAGPTARAAFALRPLSAGRDFRFDLAFTILPSIVVISIEPRRATDPFKSS